MKKDLASRLALPSISDGRPKTEHPISRLLQRRLGDASENKALAVTVGPTQPIKMIKLLEEEKIFDLYEWREVLQEDGDGGKVVVCRPKDANPDKEELTDKEYVLKMCSKEHLRNEKLELQFRHVQKRLLAFPPHPGVLLPEKVHEDGSYYYIVMKKAQGGTLFSSLLTKFGNEIIPGGVVKCAIKQVLAALGHIHSNGLLHRDIKPDNIVVHDDAVMLIDFDHADPSWDPEEPKTTSAFYGTFRFSAPEVFLGEYSQQSDLYSVGCSLYLLMTGKFPRNDDLFKPCFEQGLRRWREVVFQNLTDAPEVDWMCDPWPLVPECRDLCQKLLEFDPTRRPASAEEALRHLWFEDDSA
jgi:serine/threonine protein kinase